MIYPLANMQIIKDLVPDLTHLFAQYAAIESLAQVQDTSAPDGTVPILGGAQQNRWLLRMYSLLLLHVRLPEPLVEWRPFPGSRGAPSGLALVS